MRAATARLLATCHSPLTRVRRGLLTLTLLPSLLRQIHFSILRLHLTLVRYRKDRIIFFKKLYPFRIILFCLGFCQDIAGN